MTFSGSTPPQLTHNAHLLCQASGLDGLGWVLADQTAIMAVGLGDPPADLLANPNNTVVDAGGRYLVPALVDALTLAWEFDAARPLENASSFAAAASAGGVATAALAGSKMQPIDDLPALQAALGLNASLNTPLLVNLLAGREGGGAGSPTLTPLHRLLESAAAGGHSGGIVGAAHLQPNAASLQLLQRAWMQAAALDLPVHHLPLEASLAQGAQAIAGEMAARLGLAGLSRAAEAITLARDFAVLESCLPRCPKLHYHAALVTTAGGVAAVRAAKTRGLPVTAATAPPYFLLNDLAIGTFDSRFRLFPPLATEGDRQAVVAGIDDGTIDMIVSAHQPVGGGAKRQPFALAANGYSGLETLFALTLTLHHQHGLALSRLLDKLTAAPAKLLRQHRGRLSPGYPADHRVIDLHQGWRIDSARFHSLVRSTPFHGMLVQGGVAGG